MSSPVVSAVISLLRREVSEEMEPLVLIKSDECTTDVFLHIGFLSLALLDQHLLRADSVSAFHDEVRQLVTACVRIEDPRKFVASDKEICGLSNLAYKIIDLNRTGGVTMGGSKPMIVNPTPWIRTSIDYYRNSPSSPRTAAALASLLFKPDPLTTDARMLLDVTLHMLYTSLDAVLSKRCSLILEHKASPLMLNTSDDVVSEEPWSPTIEKWVDDLIR